MKKDYLKYYEAVSAGASWRFLFDLLRTRRPNARVALRNRSQDYKRLVNDDQLRCLHLRLHQKIYAALKEGGFYDYGEGYFYQSLKAAGITGFRDTDARVAAMNLEAWVRDKTVLEIGCNSGFLSICLASAAKRVVGFDIMPYLIEIAREVAEHFETTNVEFEAIAFEDFQSAAQFDVVLSFANHSTFDGQTKASIEEYFERCARFCADDGLLLFESHPPAYEGDGLVNVLEELGKRFSILESQVLDYGSFLDRGRTFVVARKI